MRYISKEEFFCRVYKKQVEKAEVLWYDCYTGSYIEELSDARDIGCGTSGRLGVLDASECPPTYGVPYDPVIGIIAGGDGALRKAVEGAEVITGSTRMKASGARKMVLNMISTAVMVRLGRVYENMMINLRPSNVKLRGRMIRILREINEFSYDRCEKLLDENELGLHLALRSQENNYEKDI